MLDLIQKHFCYGHYSQHASRIGPGLICWIWLPTSDLVLFFQRKPGSNTSCSEASWCARIIRPDSGRMQWAHYHFPVFILGCIVPQTAWIILCRNQPTATFILSCIVPQTAWIISCRTSPDPIWFWLTQFWPSGSRPEASQCPRTTQPTSGQHFQADPDWMQISSGILLGSVLCHLFDKVQEVSLHCHWWKMANDIMYAEFLSIYIFYIPKTLLSQFFFLYLFDAKFHLYPFEDWVVLWCFWFLFCEKENGFIFVGTRVRPKFSLTIYLQETGWWLRSLSLSLWRFLFFSLC